MFILFLVVGLSSLRAARYLLFITNFICFSSFHYWQCILSLVSLFWLVDRLSITRSTRDISSSQPNQKKQPNKQINIKNLLYIGVKANGTFFHQGNPAQGCAHGFAGEHLKTWCERSTLHALSTLFLFLARTVSEYTLHVIFSSC